MSILSYDDKWPGVEERKPRRVKKFGKRRKHLDNIVNLFRDQGCSTMEISRRLGLTEATVAKDLDTARRAGLWSI